MDNTAPLYTLLTLCVSFQSASLAIFRHQIAVIVCVEDINQFHDVRVFQTLHDLYFAAEQVGVDHAHSA